jgi:hypothetical protein
MTLHRPQRGEPLLFGKCRLHAPVCGGEDALILLVHLCELLLEVVQLRCLLIRDAAFQFGLY